MKIELSVLDLMMIGEERRFLDTIEGAKMLAQAVESFGYKRYWVAEHHDMPGIGSSATTLLMQYLAAATSKIRIGSGGVMLPNHAPLIVAEQFATLDTMFPQRIDFGVGRAPGGAGPAIRAIRGKNLERDFGQDLKEISDYLADNCQQAARGIREPHEVPVYILGSSLNSAEYAAKHGLPYVFASHFAPRFLMDAIQLYRKLFQPSPTLEKPYVIAGVNIIAADTPEEATLIASSHQKWVVQLYTGNAGLLPKPEPDYFKNTTANEKAILAEAMACTAIGDKSNVKDWLESFLQLTKVDELIIDARIYDPLSRCKSYQIAKEAVKAL
ncbi:LLM class flavin-dependent oxidoreductase [Pontibacter silvestris]|uniref:LLM class flavin-dependent oxidoreductase n=1 Tax=Pontibacter silvestris TaxID=2305183 RepID=A0ABW4WXH9_9BACT|nr:LLM class flavin-dependent oxidoreductase [Pontibacter silvestris]MCC9138473.1 LLM class flavin-dependent oxidoreductase [Pontibacter silvestris]